MRLSFLMVMLICFALQGCCGYYEPEEIPPRVFESYTPIYMARESLDSSIRLKPAQEIVNSGKIYIVNDLLFVGEKQQGFHVFDNSNPSSPVKINFVEIIASTDISVRNNMLYVNQATDLVAVQFNLSDTTIQVTKRISKIFPEMRSPNGSSSLRTPSDSVVIAWKPKN